MPGTAAGGRPPQASLYGTPQWWRSAHRGELQARRGQSFHGLRWMWNAAGRHAWQMSPEQSTAPAMSATAQVSCPLKKMGFQIRLSASCSRECRCEHLSSPGCTARHCDGSAEGGQPERHTGSWAYVPRPAAAPSRLPHPSWHLQRQHTVSASGLKPFTSHGQGINSVPYTGPSTLAQRPSWEASRTACGCACTCR